jgi:DNA recombination protein RmuC
MTTVLAFVLGLGIGMLLVWLWAASRLSDERKTSVETRVRLEAAQQSLEEQKRLLETATGHLTDTFKALSADALKNNNESFLQLARQALETTLRAAEGDLEKRAQAIDALVKPLQDALQAYDAELKAIEATRREAYGSLERHLKDLHATQQQLQGETRNLVTALRAPQVRGRWGEVTLHRVVELAGMVEYCDYIEQQTVESDAGRLRPDMVVHLPSRRTIVVDAKVSLDAYLDALAAPTEEARRAALQRHAQQLRSHMGRLATKAYWDQFDASPEFAVMFIPGESFFAAALEHDHTLLEDGMAKNVVLATPTTLIALLRAVAYGWRQEQVAQNAQRISDLGRQLHERLGKFARYFHDTGAALEKAVAAYNRGVVSLESRVLVAARRFKELGAATGEELQVIDIVEQTPRALNAPGVDEGGAQGE